MTTGPSLAVAPAKRRMVCELLNNSDCRIARAPFDIADISPVNAGLFRIGLLTPAPLIAEPSHIASEAFSNVHR